jgi:hypothetical protein
MSMVTAAQTRVRMEAAREDTAKGLLGWDKVAAKIGEAAGQGHGQALFTPPAGVSIKATTTAAALIEKLTATGFRCDWRERRDAGDVLNHDLVVSWEGAAVSV